MNKVFSSMQRKDKDMATGQYAHPAQESVNISHEKKNRWPLAAVCLVLLAIVVLAVLFL